MTPNEYIKLTGRTDHKDYAPVVERISNEEEVMETNINKLKERFKAEFTVEEALNRNLENEEKALSKQGYENV